MQNESITTLSPSYGVMADIRELVLFFFDGLIAYNHVDGRPTLMSSWDGGAAMMVSGVLMFHSFELPAFFHRNTVNNTVARRLAM
jgi:hypothetical protein